MEQETCRLKAEIAELRAAPRGLLYRGVYEDGATYHKGNFVTRSGSVWHCQADAGVRGIAPGSNHPAWASAVKRGADGRDGKDAPQQ